jgi:AraC-like DNA-binding protein
VTDGAAVEVEQGVDDVIFSDEVAGLLGYSVDTLRSMASRGQGPTPRRRRRYDPVTGLIRRCWDRSAVIAWRDAPRGQHGKGLRIHRLVAAADRLAPRTYAAIARDLGVSERTVSRHLNGQCGCGSDA